MSDRHEKWVRVEPGHVIPAGQPYRVEFPEMCPEWLAHDVDSVEFDNDEHSGDFKPCGHSFYVETSRWFMDSSWKPPLDLPTEPTWGIAVSVNGNKMFAEWYQIAPAVKTLIEPSGMWQMDQVADFIPLTDEQIARIEAAR